MEKETIDLNDVVEILGERPYPMPDFMLEYLKEVQYGKDLQEEIKKGSYQSEIFSNEDKSGIKNTDNNTPSNDNGKEEEGKFPNDDSKKKKKEKDLDNEDENESGHNKEEKKIQDSSTIVKDK